MSSSSMVEHPAPTNDGIEPPEGTTGRRGRLFRFLIAHRYWVVAFYALLLIPAVFYAVRVPQDNAIDRLIIKTDPDYQTSQAFSKVFGKGEFVLLLGEAKNPFDPKVIRRMAELEEALSRIPKVGVNSLLSLYRRHKGGLKGTAEEAQDLRTFAFGTDIFRKQGFVGDSFLGMALVLDVNSTAERREVMARLNAATAPFELNPAPLSRLRKVGEPYVIEYLDQDTRQTSLRFFPLFFLFVILLNLALYRSVRALFAFIVTLLVSVALTVGYIGLTGGEFTIISAVVPMTVLITCTATLVYVHSRFVDCPPGRSFEDQQVFALCNKLLPCSASIFATAVGFAALVVSKIRPIREMGIWVAVGLLIAWVVIFTLFPAMQRILRTPTLREKKAGGDLFLRYANWLPLFSYRYRYVLVPFSLVMCGVGLVSLFGFGDMVKPMELETKSVEYINHDSTLYKDTKEIERVMAGLTITEVWLQGEFGDMTDVDVVRGLSAFTQALEREPGIGAAVGLPFLLRTMRYLDKKGDQLPDDEDELDKLVGDVETLRNTEPMVGRFVDKTLAQTHISVISKTVPYEGFLALQKRIQALWTAAIGKHPAMKDIKLVLTGHAPLQAKTAYHMVPTLVESFILSAVIIFAAFLVVFKSGPARIMAMIPSLFAILVMFAFMRATGLMLNVATILIATTVLGTSENDQIHFFYHFLEKRKNGTTEESLRHSLAVAGRAIWFATLINAGGFLAFAIADLPPIRQFGILSALAFALSMLADFTALPAALWMVFREKPDSLKPQPPAG